MTFNPESKFFVTADNIQAAKSRQWNLQQGAIVGFFDPLTALLAREPLQDALLHT